MKKEIKVGILTIVSLTILYLGFNYLKGIDFMSSTKTYYAVYENIGGLNVSNPVVINGLSVGRVSKTKMLQNSNNQILVAIDIDSDIQLGYGTIATLYNQDVLGSKAIELLPSENTHKKHLDGDTLKSGIDEGITAFLKESAKPMTDNLGTTVTRLNELLANLNGNSYKIDSTLSNFMIASAHLDQAIVANDLKIRKLLDSLTHTSNMINKALTQVQPVLLKANTLLDTLNQLELNKTVNELRTVMANVNENITAISEANGTLGKLIHEDSLYNNLNAAVVSLDSLLSDIEENPERYVHISVFGKKDK